MTKIPDGYEIVVEGAKAYEALKWLQERKGDFIRPTWEIPFGNQNFIDLNATDYILLRRKPRTQRVGLREVFAWGKCNPAKPFRMVGSNDDYVITSNGALCNLSSTGNCCFCESWIVEAEWEIPCGDE